ncbi:MAG: Glutamate dehydrogenase [Thermotoga petrophila]|uniref:Glutamate dehydrogenase n=1 Tax=Thermotoga petrophila TaxID=93929 RepID=A0A101ERH9_9THEM|nr:MAG: Glutamate dehydrogenase [Thermotoga petrophila]MDK2870931.1 glutamate dehydrogenase [bacterium]
MKLSTMGDLKPFGPIYENAQKQFLKATDIMDLDPNLGNFLL